MTFTQYIQTSTKGQIIIPYKIRNQLKINQSSLLKINLENSRIIIQLANQETTHSDLLNSLKQTKNLWKNIDSHLEKTNKKIHTRYKKAW